MQSLDQFEASIRRKGFHLRTYELNWLVRLVARYVKHPTQARLQTVHNWFVRWKRKDPKEFATRGRPIEDDFYEVIRKEANTRGFTINYSAIVPKVLTAFDLVSKHEWTLERMQQFASGDCKQFRTAIAPGMEATVIARYDAAQARGCFTGGGGASIGLNALFGNTAWNATKLRKEYLTVFRNEAAVCTTFAQAGAHLLTQGLDVTSDHVPRVEIMSLPNHVFVVVGRDYNNAPVQANTPVVHFSQWGDEWFIVDPWAGAMGWGGVIYWRTHNYPFTGMLNTQNVSLIMATR